jgi:hypothetical protein
MNDAKKRRGFGEESPADTKDNANGTPDSPVMRLQISLVAIGRDRALASGALEPKDADVKALQEHAEAMARETRRDLYDPRNKHQDRLRDDEYKKGFADRAETELALKYSAAEVREKEQAAARLLVTERPRPSLWLMAALIFGIGATIAPTLHDFLFASVDDTVIASLFSLVTGGFVASVIVWGILASVDATGRRTATNWMGLVAGTVISGGLGLLRWSTAMDTEEIALAIALTAVEIGLIVIAEWVAAGLRHHFIEWRERQTERDRAQAEIDAAKSEHQRRQSRLNELNEKISDHIRHVEERDLRNVNVNELMATAVKAVTDGYCDGIAINVGRVIGVGGVR